MKYIQTTIRRQDRLLDEDAARALLAQGEYGVLSMGSTDSGAYGVPINYVWDKEDAIYLHGAVEGRKLRMIDIDKRVSFCVVGKTEIISSKFTTEYESIILQGTAVRGLSDQEKWKALTLLLDKYSPADKEVGLKYSEKSFPRTEIIRIDIAKFSGKCKRM